MSAQRVVFDCNVLFQALISSDGPAWSALEAVKRRQISLFLSDQILDELSDVATRPHLVRRFHIAQGRLDEFVASLERHATKLAHVPPLFHFERDPDDEHYVNLALAASAKLIVSRDADLLALGDQSRPEGREFALRFPALQILTPPQLLTMLASSSPE